MAAAMTAISALATNPYRYGVADTSITIPFVQAAIDPRLYPGDYALLQRPYYYTYLWDAIALAQRHLGLALPALFFTIYLAALFATFLGLIRIANRLFEGPLAGMLAVALLLFDKPTLGGIEAVHWVLSTREAAIPLLLFGLEAILDRRMVRAAVLFGIAYLVHPLTTHYAVAMALAGAVVDGRSHARRWWTALAVFVVLASPILIWHARSSPAHFAMLPADPAWVAALHVRSPHHFFPFTWGWGFLAQGVIVLLAFLFGWSRRGSLDPRAHRMVAAWVVAIVAMCLGGLVFSELMPLGIALMLEPLRSYQFMVLLSSLYLANAIERGLAPGRGFGESALVVAVGALTLWGMPHVQRPIAGFAVVVGVLLAWRLARSRPIPARAAALSLVLVLAAGGALTHVRDVHEHEGWAFSFGSAQEPEWLDVQRWARAHTAPDATFIVAPRQPGEFRIGSERSVYADWEDGGLMNGNPVFAAEWLRRMRMLGLAASPSASADFCALPRERVLAIAAELGAPRRRVFIVLPDSCGETSWPVLYANARFRVCQVATEAGAAAARP